MYIDTIFEIFNQKFVDNDNENTFQAKQKKIYFENIDYKFNERSEEVL